MSERHRIVRIGAGGRAASPQVVADLAEVLVDGVDGGASASFMAPLELDRAAAFWRDVVAGAERGERVLLVAEEVATGAVVGTVQVVPAREENQPHRGDITKLIVHRRARRNGLADVLMDTAEVAAVEAGLTLLVLDTASPEAERVYERRAWQRVGTIAGYALLPEGGLCDTTIFCKHLAPPPAPGPDVAAR